MKKICFIAPYAQLYETVKRLIKSEGYDNVSVVLGDLEEGVEQAFKALDSGADLLISRGGTYTMIHERIRDANIFELKISALDIMNSLRYVLERKEEIGIIGYYNIIYGYDILTELIGTKMRVILLNDKESVEEKVQKCVDEGVKFFIGDTIVNRVCKKLGYECYLIESSSDSVKMAIEQANESLKNSQELLEKNRRYRALMNCVHEGILAIDSYGNILACNKAAEELLGISKKNIIGKNISQIHRGKDISHKLQSQQVPIIDEIIDVSGTQTALSVIPISVKGEITGSVISIQGIKKLQRYETQIRSQLLEKGFKAKYTFQSIVYKSSVMEECIKIAQKYSLYDSSVLVYGESGVGKELFAQSIHNASPRKNRPFVAVNCAALAKSIIESELFGYTEGAFTGARKGGKAGFFEMAHRGTIFLDEISELPLNVQGQLLRVLQEKEILRLGDSKVTPLDIRIICATNQNLEKMVELGTFRQDLLYRINTLSFTIPRLNDRSEDILLLASTFMNNFSDKYNKDVHHMTSDACEYLLHHEYRGNVRELQGMIERAVILAESSVISKKELDIQRSGDTNVLSQKNNAFPLSIYNQSLKEIENDYIKNVWIQQNKSVSETCRILKINRSTLWRRLKQLNIET